MTESAHEFDDGMDDSRRVLFLDQGFLKNRKGKPVHGVELFRLLLLPQLLQRGVRCTIWFDPSWRETVQERLGEDKNLRVLYTPGLGGTLPNALWAVASERERHDTIVYGDARRGMIPAMHLGATRKLGQRVLVFAHRRPHPRLLQMTRSLDFDVLCVSEFVAERYRNAGRSVDVFYGIPNSDRFHPTRAGERADGDGIISFCLLGRLPNISKGHELAIESYRMLDENIRSQCRLHLASFIEPTDLGIEGVVAHEWIRSDEVPAFLREMDVMLTLSSNETFSQAIVQGMLTGLPIIATRHPVFVEKLDTGGGVLVDRLPASISSAMAQLARDGAERRRMGVIARQTALYRYVWNTDIFIRKYLFPDGSCVSECEPSLRRGHH